MVYISSRYGKYSILLVPLLLVLEFQKADTGLAVVLTFKRSNIRCRQEYYRKAARTRTPRLYILAMTRYVRKLRFAELTTYINNVGKALTWLRKPSP